MAFSLLFGAKLEGVLCGARQGLVASHIQCTSCWWQAIQEISQPWTSGACSSDESSVGWGAGSCWFESLVARHEQNTKVKLFLWPSLGLLAKRETRTQTSETPHQVTD